MRKLGVVFPEEDLAPPCPPSCVYLLHWFADAAKQRQDGFNGPQALPWSEFESWARLNRIVLRPFEIRVLTMLDKLYRIAAAKAAERHRAADKGRGR